MYGLAFKIWFHFRLICKSVCLWVFAPFFLWPVLLTALTKLESSAPFYYLFHFTVYCYAFLLQKLLQHTDTDHPDHYFLETSLDTFRSTLETMNEVMEQTVQLATSNSKNNLAAPTNRCEIYLVFEMCGKVCGFNAKMLHDLCNDASIKGIYRYLKLIDFPNSP